MNLVMGDYKRIEKAIEYIRMNYKEQPSLKKIASMVNLSEYYFQRMFTQWAGISPKKFMQFLSIEYAKTALRESRPLLNVAYSSGFSSASRLYDLFVTVEGMTPGEYKDYGRSLTITYGYCESPFGVCLILATEKGICGLRFVDPKDGEREEKKMRMIWPESRFTSNESLIKQLGKKIFDRKQADAPDQLHCFLKGTRFQIKVWEALLRIPFGALVSYQTIAEFCGDPKSSRAVANAIASNPVAFLIPCHRVIRTSGVISEYQWGAAKKNAMIGWEAAHVKA